MVAGKIREYLQNNGIKQTWLAEQLDLPVTTFSGIINGKTTMKADMFIQICKILNVRPELFSDDE